MKSKVILGLFLTFVALAFAVNLVAASDCNDYVCITDVEVDDVSVLLHEAEIVAGQVSDTVPVEVYFTAMEDMSDVRIKVYIEGYREEISAQTPRFHIVEDSTYVKRFTLDLPSSGELDDLTEDLELLVRISAKGEESLEWFRAITMQRDLYSLYILSVDAPATVTSGSTFPVDIVVENNGNDRLENIYVRASIPDLGVQRRVYVGDLDPLDEIEESEYDECWDDCDWLNDKDLDEEDTRYKRIYLTLPRSATPGEYILEVQAYNADTTVETTQRISVDTSETGVLPTVTSRTIAPGDETTFDVVLINPNEGVAVYTITPQEAPGLIVEVQDPVVVVSGEDSKTVRVNVRATKSAEEGTHVVILNVNSENGELVKQVNLSVNVEKGRAFTGTRSDAVFILTVILVIVFVVLLIILIVLLTKKPAEAEEYGETSYY